MTTQSVGVDCEPTGDGWRCRVRVGDDPGATEHDVSVARRDLDRLAPGSADPQALVLASFRFMLEREPRESILTRFDLPTIGRYFPDYPDRIGSLIER